ncbi:hypothetical protein J2782_003295 [Brucella pseudogrignonensis]|uniref:Uncharacterized protein n=1 Tax=Brucella pseudogrignonensis TaxID=419475 RepID=A0ABU1MBZ1_9HYPH|nr:hypothetical protein [Brucella pseudogrignonensis]
MFLIAIQVPEETPGKRESGRVKLKSGTAPATVGGELTRYATGDIRREGRVKQRTASQETCLDRSPVLAAGGVSGAASP